jgi:SAM-dependent methyltransferase
MNPILHPPGQTPAAGALRSARNLASHGFFLTPLLQPGFDVLDAGCGTATLTSGLAEAVFPGRVIGLDESAAQLETGRRLAEGLEILNLDFVAASASAMPFPDHSFDVVFSHGLLEHLAEPARVLGELHRVTRPGGFIGVAARDWDAFEWDPLPKRLAAAVRAFRDLEERQGGNTRAGALLGDWLPAAGFTPLAVDGWMEVQENPGRLAEALAQALATDGQPHHARALRDWADLPGARFGQAWRYATGVRADGARFHRLVTE